MMMRGLLEGVEVDVGKGEAKELGGGGDCRQKRKGVAAMEVDRVLLNLHTLRQESRRGRRGQVFGFGGRQEGNG